MATILMISLSGSPGGSTAAMALTRCWYRKAILLEADTSKASSFLSGYLKGRYGSDKNLINLAVAADQSGHLDFNDLWAQLLPLDTDNPEQAQQWLLPGLMEAKSAPSLDHLWGDIISAADTFEASGTDVIIDAGRWSVGDKRTALLRAADAVIIVARPSLPDAFAIRYRLEEIQGDLASIGRGDHLSTVLIERPSSPYSSHDMARSLGLRITGSLPWDEKTAAVFSDGAQVTNPGRFEKRPYIRAIDHLSGALRSELDERRGLLNEALDIELEDLA
ncbi:hypothetical protein [Arthrobacter cryoconiti]|uniref:Cellulose biosynthesis protein BcsQ n=1 Tax=Arthrobacter cryoconiti TaxID=748907 RepID=A0ABV8R4C9_9MICC|nr:hypothetical protein [Arthrobacter cryoconiti]MCC9069349.1 hypothetical protein [Arthrobacter cryoconiti]